jgi:hypothetical protein
MLKKEGLTELVSKKNLDEKKVKEWFRNKRYNEKKKKNSNII